MSGSSAPVKDRAGGARSLTHLLWFGLPLLALLLASAWLISSDWLKAFDAGAPPVETLTFERVVLNSDGIHLKVRAGGSEPLQVAQVQVDEAYWTFTQDPPGPLGHLSTAWLHIPYPWVLGEKHEITVVSRTGATFTHEIEVAVPTPTPQAGQLIPQALLGVFVGVVPVVIGMLFYPAIRTLGRRGIDFVLALTVGLLAYLLVDSFAEAAELARETAAAFQGVVMVVVTALVTFLALLAVGRRHGAPSGVALATYIALGIGLHNLGEGLAIGAAFAGGVAALGTFLVLGFTLHNVTEGIGIVAPLAAAEPSQADALDKPRPDAADRPYGDAPGKPARLDVADKPPGEAVGKPPRLDVLDSRPRLDVFDNRPRLDVLDSRPRLDVLDNRPRLDVFGGLALLAGAPAVAGIWIGSFSSAPQWTALALAIGVGAILQVIVEVGAYLVRSSTRSGGTWLSPAMLAGFVLGVGVMYATAMLVKV